MEISLLLLIVVYSAGVFSDSSGTEPAEIKKLLTIHHQFEDVEKDIEEQLEMSPKRQAALDKNEHNVIDFKIDHVHKEGDNIDDINEKTEVGKLLYQGDIFLTSSQANEIISGIEEEEGIINRTKRQAFRDHRYPNSIWRNGVNYAFESSINDDVKRIFKKATKNWEKDTCIDFRENSTAEDRISVFVHSGCWSYVGRQGNPQHLSLGSGCETVSIATHEIGHAIGMFHTQSRHDRDNFVYVNVKRIQKGWVGQFNKETTETNENYGVPYDYGSIMHYSATAAAKSGKKSLVPKDPKYSQTLGSPFVSFYELLMLNKHYNCLKKCDPKNSAKCKMGGFPHPRDCSRCVCPSGYGGKFCGKRPEGCGEVLKATSSPQTLRKWMGTNKHGKAQREDFTRCYYWIEAPKGSLIEITIDKITNGLAVAGCVYAGVEIKTHVDQRLTGYRFCAPEDKGVKLVSNHHIVPIIIYNRAYETEVVLSYRTVPGRPQMTTPASVELWQLETREQNFTKLDLELKALEQTNSVDTTSNECKDDKRCATLMERENFCSSSFPEHTKKRYCAKTCHLCNN